MPCNIVLVGFMASGKTTVGRLLATYLGWEFVDTDIEVEKVAGSSIPAIFSQKGEAYFRQVEKEVITRVVAGSRKVIATGGGVVSDPENRERLWAGNKVVWLKVPLDIVWQRAAGDKSRPLLQGRTREQVEALLKERELYYAMAHLHVEVEGKGPSQIAREIMEGLGKWPENCG
ncbi:MAG: shikimate kinase [Thermanaeromonas sp.]|uniref:shikimate kinase n=1 Tax=Thermanaeromonas sp. TaxID=2003697 RepID=UPI00243F3955|nr:shikimate kinase [Thermanaeromonas sp.]MCG0278418.1 shikimate kinase [Thermanaeromonas sp.]